MATEKRLIDANALMKVLKEEHDIVMQDPEVKSSVKWREAVVFHSVSQTVRHAPTVDAVEVVHGRWKYYHKQNIAVCTNCSFERDLDANFGKAIYCPNCGAKMDGDGNGT